jgi:Mg/Co/Ni transporter MgtE
MSMKRAAIKKNILLKKLEATKLISDKNFNPLAPATIAQKIKKSPSKKVVKVMKALGPAKAAKVMKKLPLKKIMSLEKSLSPRRLRPRK